MEQELIQILLTMGFTLEQIHLDSAPNGSVGGFIVSPRFMGQSQIERQDVLWNHLEQILPKEKLHKIIALLTMTPDEVEDDTDLREVAAI
jgi:acid stress-induced BolA-like protein IbaG/YrbA